MADPLDFRVGVFGSKDSGGSILALQFIQGSAEGYIPHIDDQCSKVINVDNRAVSVSIIDSNVIDEMPEMRYSYFEQIQAFLFVINIDDPYSIEYIYKMYKDIQEVKDNVVGAIAVNNSHPGDEKSPEIYKKFENELKCKVIEISDQSNESINKPFEYLVRKFLHFIKKRARWSVSATINGIPQISDQLEMDNAQSKRRSSLFAKHSSKKKMQKESIQHSKTEAKIDVASNKLIDDLKTLALNKATQLKNTLLHSKQLESEIESLKKYICDLEKQNQEYLEKISILEQQLKQKDDQNIDDAKNNSEPKENKLLILNNNDMKKLEQQEIIGRGSISEVRKVDVNRELALKVFDIDAFKQDVDIDDNDKIKEANDNQITKDIIRQYEIVNNINNPSIAKAMGFYLGDENHPPSILLEYYPYNLMKLVEELTNEERVSIIYEISKVMNDVHNRKIVHLGLNPGNILLDSNKRVKLTDFGLSSLLKNGSASTSKNQVNGSGQFMAPELLLSENDCTEKVDIFAFGALVYYILTNGKNLEINYETGEISITNPVNEFSNDLIQKCCSKLADQRPAFNEIVESIEQNEFKLIDEIDASLLQLTS